MIKTGPTGIEPAATRLRAERSARLSYGPQNKINSNIDYKSIDNILQS